MVLGTAEVQLIRFSASDKVLRNAMNIILIYISQLGKERATSAKTISLGHLQLKY